MANFPITNGSPASRRLFPECPREELVLEEDERAQMLELHIKDNVAESREKWNFDFENEAPLEGEWEWEKASGFRRRLPDDEATSSETEQSADSGGSAGKGQS